MARGRKAGIRTEASVENVEASHRIVQTINGIDIEEGIPVPTGQRTRQSKYPYELLGLNQSFFIPGMKAKSFTSSVYGRNKKGDKKWKAADFEREGVAGVRVWRIK